ncbi:FAD-dependent oxidoreductase [Chloroflexota bacterium]
MFQVEFDPLKEVVSFVGRQGKLPLSRMNLAYHAPLTLNQHTASRTGGCALGINKLLPQEDAAMESMKRLEKLFQPGRIGSMEIKNRLIMPAMGTGLPDDEGNVTDRLIDYFVARACGGVGLIITGVNLVRKFQEPYIINSIPPFQAIYNDKFIPGLKRLSDAVHENGGKIALQLWYAGISWYNHMYPDDTDKMAVGPSAVPYFPTGLTPRELSKNELKAFVEDFAEAARRTRDAGFDAVEIHGAHAHFLNEFMSPYTNRRTDEYGGSPEKRARFACEIIALAREKVGPHFPILFRMTGDEFFEGGTTIQDALKQAPLFVKAGADALHVSGGIREGYPYQFPTYLQTPGLLSHLAAEVKKIVDVPVITVGKIDPPLGERILREGKADFIAIGRPLIADPELPNKAKEGRLDEVCQCLYCNSCLAGDRQVRHGIFCTVNPAAGREKEYELKPASSPKRVMVVGGGLAGMEAARFCAARGHRVSLYERSNKLGGQWDIASQQDYKENFANVTKRLSSDLKKLGVSVMLNKEVTRQFIEAAKPDVVILATGALPATLDIPGIEGENVVQANDVIMGKVTVGDTVVVVGGRHVGIEVALYLAKLGKKVHLVTRRHLGRDIHHTIMLTLAPQLIESGVCVYPNSTVVEIIGNCVKMKVDYMVPLVAMKADTVVLAVGATPEKTLAVELKGVVPELHVIGDCMEPRDARHAIHEGAEAGRAI